MRQHIIFLVASMALSVASAPLSVLSSRALEVASTSTVGRDAELATAELLQDDGPERRSVLLRDVRGNGVSAPEARDVRGNGARDIENDDDDAAPEEVARDVRGNGARDVRGNGSRDVRGNGARDVRGNGSRDVRGNGARDVRGN